MKHPFKPMIQGEAYPDFEETASTQEKLATEMAARTSGVVPQTPDFERTATPEERHLRLVSSLKNEKKTDPILETSLEGTILAKYKIEVTFVHSRSAKGETACGIQVWESGKRFHGGGDQLMFVCTDTTEDNPRKRGGCGGFISADNIHAGVAICESCKRAVKADNLGQIYTMKAEPKKIAGKLVEFFRKLDSNADFFIKYHHTDVRFRAMEQAKGPDVARRLKGMHIYPLYRIIQDTASGASLERLVTNFLKS